MRRVAVVALLALAFPASASAHATLEHTSPSFRARVESAPKVVRLDFDQGVKPLPNSITVYTARGRVVSGAAHGGTFAHDVVVPVRRPRT